MKILLELNKKYNTGFQIHCIASEEDGDPADMDEVIDYDPFSLWKARMLAEKALEISNKKLGTSFSIDEVLSTTMEGLRVNARNDLNSARLFEKVRDSIRNGDATFEEDAAEAIQYLSDAFKIWDEELDEVAEEELYRFCEYVSMNLDDEAGSKQLFHELTGLPVDDAISWISEKATRVFEETHDVFSMMGYVIR